MIDNYKPPVYIHDIDKCWLTTQQRHCRSSRGARIRRHNSRFRVRLGTATAGTCNSGPDDMRRHSSLQRRGRPNLRWQGCSREPETPKAAPDTGTVRLRSRPRRWTQPAGRKRSTELPIRTATLPPVSCPSRWIRHPYRREEHTGHCDSRTRKNSTWSISRRELRGRCASRVGV